MALCIQEVKKLREAFKRSLYTVYDILGFKLWLSLSYGDINIQPCFSISIYSRGGQSAARGPNPALRGHLFVRPAKDIFNFVVCKIVIFSSCFFKSVARRAQNLFETARGPKNLPTPDLQYVL
jgi:hypothetical protein